MTLSIDLDYLPMVWNGFLNVLKLAVTNENYNAEYAENNDVLTVFDVFSSILPKDEKEHAALFGLRFSDLKPLDASDNDED